MKQVGTSFHSASSAYHSRLTVAACLLTEEPRRELRDVHTFQDFAQACCIYYRAFVSGRFCIYHSVF